MNHRSGGTVARVEDDLDAALELELLGDFIEIDEIRRFAGGDNCNMTRLALNLSGYVNGVAKRHAETTRRMFPGYRVRAITNGVHPATWTSDAFARLYDHYVSGWRHEPEMLVRADCCIPNGEVWQAHAEAKQSLLDEVAARAGVALDPALPVLGFARRMTAYKRPELLFRDLPRLAGIAGRLAVELSLHA